MFRDVLLMARMKRQKSLTLVCQFSSRLTPRCSAFWKCTWDFSVKMKRNGRIIKVAGLLLHTVIECLMVFKKKCYLRSPKWRHSWKAGVIWIHAETLAPVPRPDHIPHTAAESDFPSALSTHGGEYCEDECLERFTTLIITYPTLADKYFFQNPIILFFVWSTSTFLRYIPHLINVNLISILF